MILMGSRTFSPPYNQYLVPTWPQTPTGLRFLCGPATPWVWLLCEYLAHASLAVLNHMGTVPNRVYLYPSMNQLRCNQVLPHSFELPKNGSKLIPLRGSVDPEKKPNQTKRVWFLHRESVGHAQNRVADAPILIEPDAGRGGHLI